jgi:hypothetical protein
MLTKFTKADIKVNVYINDHPLLHLTSWHLVKNWDGKMWKTWHSSEQKLLTRWQSGQPGSSQLTKVDSKLTKSILCEVKKNYLLGWTKVDPTVQMDTLTILFMVNHLTKGQIYLPIHRLQPNCLLLSLVQPMMLLGSPLEMYTTEISLYGDNCWPMQLLLTSLVYSSSVVCTGKGGMSYPWVNAQ